MKQFRTNVRRSVKVNLFHKNYLDRFEKNHLFKCHAMLKGPMYCLTLWKKCILSPFNGEVPAFVVVDILAR